MKVLVVAPHCDDETLGAGGVIARHASEGDHVTVAVMTGHGKEPHPIFEKNSWDTVRSEGLRAFEILGVTEVIFEELPAVLVDDLPHWEVNKVAQSVIDRVEPEILYVPFPYDLHVDHRAVFHAFSVAWRPNSTQGSGIKSIYTYEVQSETHWSTSYLEPGFTPNTWVDISDYLDKKLDALRCFGSQMYDSPHARSIEAIEHLARWRGSQVGVAAAEAFVKIRELRL